jgi:hypothetical protein
VNLKLKLPAAVGLGLVLALAVGAPSASAKLEVQLYHPAAIDRDFSTSQGKWTARNKYQGLCIQTLTCPPLDNSFVATGGADGASDGYINTDLMDITGLVSEEKAFWESPVFRWRGVKNQRPDSVRFSIDRKTNVTNLIGVGGKASYNVDLIDITKGSKVAKVVFRGRNLDTTKDWRSEGPFAIARDQLTIGHRYYIRITSIFSTNVEVLDAGENGYDNVVITAKKNFPSGGNKKGRCRHGHKRRHSRNGGRCRRR